MAAKALIVFGTRPEAIKLAPVVRAIKAKTSSNVVICSTGQHRDLVSPVCQLFGMSCDYDLQVMRESQDTAFVASAVIERLSPIIDAEKPDFCIVQGDTTTAFAAALSAYYRRVPVVHVEAGLRTGDLQSPWPEEGNRALIGQIADYHFAPTELAASNLRAEDVNPDRIFVVGNTVVDAAQQAHLLVRAHPQIAARFDYLDPAIPLILFTMHRRESFGAPIENVFKGLQQFCASRNVQVVFPVHPNPSVSGPARTLLRSQPNVFLCDPLGYDELIYLLAASRFVITDSGGIVEEAPSFGKPVLVLRQCTERSETVDSGTAMLCGTDPKKIFDAASELLEDGALFAQMSDAENPYGDGQAAERIVEQLLAAEKPVAVAA